MTDNIYNDDPILNHNSLQATNLRRDMYDQEYTQNLDEGFEDPSWMQGQYSAEAPEGNFNDGFTQGPQRRNVSDIYGQRHYEEFSMQGVNLSDLDPTERAFVNRGASNEPLSLGGQNTGRTTSNFTQQNPSGYLVQNEEIENRPISVEFPLLPAQNQQMVENQAQQIQEQQQLPQQVNNEEQKVELTEQERQKQIENDRKFLENQRISDKIEQNRKEREELFQRKKKEKAQQQAEQARLLQAPQTDQIQPQANVVQSYYGQSNEPEIREIESQQVHLGNPRESIQIAPEAPAQQLSTQQVAPEAPVAPTQQVQVQQVQNQSVPAVENQVQQNPVQNVRRQLVQAQQSRNQLSENQNQIQLNNQRNQDFRRLQFLRNQQISQNQRMANQGRPPVRSQVQQQIPKQAQNIEAPAQNPQRQQENFSQNQQIQRNQQAPNQTQPQALQNSQQPQRRSQPAYSQHWAQQANNQSQSQNQLLQNQQMENNKLRRMLQELQQQQPPNQQRQQMDNSNISSPIQSQNSGGVVLRSVRGVQSQVFSYFPYHTMMMFGARPDHEIHRQIQAGYLGVPTFSEISPFEYQKANRQLQQAKEDVKHALTLWASNKVQFVYSHPDPEMLGLLASNDFKAMIPFDDLFLPWLKEWKQIKSKRGWNMKICASMQGGVFNQ